MYVRQCLNYKAIHEKYSHITLLCHLRTNLHTYLHMHIVHILYVHMLMWAIMLKVLFCNLGVKGRVVAFCGSVCMFGGCTLSVLKCIHAYFQFKVFVS